MCEALGVSETGYYRFVRAMAKPDKDELLSAEIKKVLDESPYNDNYGVPRMQLVLEKRGIKVGLRRLKRIMRKHGWLHEKRRRPHGITKANPEAMITENISHDHQFNWWFGDAPERGGLLAPPKGGVESTILAASQGGYFSVLLSL
jgi:hypothetical protein